MVKTVLFLCFSLSIGAKEHSMGNGHHGGNGHDGPHHGNHHGDHHHGGNHGGHHDGNNGGPHDHNIVKDKRRGIVEIISIVS